MTSIIIDDFDPTVVGTRTIAPDFLVIDEPLSPYLTERQVVSVLVFDGEMVVEVVEETDVLIFDEETTIQVTDSLGQQDFLIITDGGPPGPRGPVGPPGAVAVYEQPDDPGDVAVGVLWIDTDEFVPTGAEWTQMTQAEYDALPVKDPNTLYVVVG
jgi:hypothetical protein